MNIVLFTPIYPEVNRQDLIHDSSAIHYITKKWAEQNHNVIVIHLYQHSIRKINESKWISKLNAIEDYVYEGVRILLYECQLFIPKKSKISYLYQLNLVKLINRYFKRNISEFNPDIVIAHFPTMYPILFRNVLKDIPKIGVLHNYDIRQKISVKHTKRNIFSLNDVSELGVRSKKIKTKINNTYIPNKEIFIVNSGIPRDIISPIKTSYFLTNVKLRLLYVGKLEKNKNVDILIKAVASLIRMGGIGLELHIIGDGSLYSEYDKLINEYGVNKYIRMLGRLDRKQVLDYMEKCDIFIMVSKPETLGLVYLEAMAKGLIVVGTKNEGIDGIIIDSYNGFLINPIEEELRSVIIKISKIPKDQEMRIRNNMYKTINLHTEELVAEEYISNIRKTICDKGKKIYEI